MFNRLCQFATLAASAALVTTAAPTADAMSLLSGFDSNTLTRTDDGSTGAVALGFDINFFGTTFDSTFVNNNGNITFGSPLGTFTPFDLTSTGTAIIAPFFADVDTRPTGSSEVTYGQGTVDGRDAFGATYENVGYFSQRTDLLNSFQVVLVDRSDVADGAFDFFFNYDQIEWETGDASGGNGGLGGSSARAGFSAGTGDLGTFLELAGSAVNGAFLDGGPNSLAESESFQFEVRNGDVNPVDPVDPVDPNVIPSPAAAGIGLLAIAGGLIRRRRRFDTV